MYIWQQFVEQHPILEAGVIKPTKQCLQCFQTVG